MLMHFIFIWSKIHLRNLALIKWTYAIVSDSHKSKIKSELFWGEHCIFVILKGRGIFVKQITYWCLNQVSRTFSSFVCFCADNPNKVCSNVVFSKDLDVGNIAEGKNKDVCPPRVVHFYVGDTQ